MFAIIISNSVFLCDFLDRNWHFHKRRREQGHALALLGTITLFAQEQKEVQNLPVLQEWYSWKGARAAKISYLPNFYGKGGQHAITQKRDGKSTWFNRFPFDTTNQFTWKDSYFVAQGDFNNDGFHDYWCAGCYVYKGYAKDSMPEKEPVQQYDVLGADPYVMDINNDGFDDILMVNNNGKTLLSFVFGNSDLSSMKVTVLPEYWDDPNHKLAHTVGVYTNEENKPRVIIYVLRDYFEGFYLYGIRTENKGDSVQMYLDELDKIEISKMYKDEPKKYWHELTMIYQEKNTTAPFINIYEAPKIVTDPPQSKGFIIENDRFVKNRNDAPGAGYNSVVGGSIDGDNIPDIIELDTIIENNQTKWIYKVYPGNPQFSDNISKAFLYEPKGFNIRTKYIGDVNNDGIGDIALGSDDCIFIYLGLNWRTVGATDEYTDPAFIIQQNEPNPVKKDRQAVLPVSLKNDGNYTLQLYNVQGLKIKELFNGFLNEGEIKLPLDLTGFSTGIYIVKMTDGTITRERAIMIGE